VAKAPEQTEAQTQLGTLLLEMNDTNGFLNWHHQLPASAETHPDIWYLRGMFAISREEPRTAIRCLWEALRRDPDHRRGCYQLAQRLTLAGESQRAKPFADRFALLEEVGRLVTKGDDSSSNDINPETMLRIAQRMRTLGRLWEASAWFEYAQKRSNGAVKSDSEWQELKTRLTNETPLTLAEANPAGSADFSHYPLPSWKPGSQSPPTSNESSVDSKVVFQNVAQDVGLDFRYFNGADPSSGIARMFEFSGGGVAVLDYDGDLWPDLYLTQGCAWPPGTGQVLYRDRLYRNMAGHRFEDVTTEAGLGDDQYSQGATVGDYNNDGFPDLLLGNIGANRLYQNLGDGTFADVTDSANLHGEEWTSSCLIADLNHDSMPDLYCVNYLGGPGVFTRKCEQNGVPIQCPLHYFPSAQDRVFVNLGDGRFEDVTESWGVVLPNGKGLGIVAGDFDETGRISLFIANDDTPNFFLVPRTDHSTKGFSYSDDAVVSGLAFGDFGTAQSCMGVAAGDTNNDGLLDLYVTNFTNEHNSLCLQQPGVGFADRARAAGLHMVTMREMGWGTQFL
ncbi:MAG: VCBS repeat-containing protein, partial [Planctomycetaceae bacterium]|nr:VCBS repeat-containing protein [Planctomycetaceae bacterium]